MVYTRTWQDRIPTNMRFGRKVEDAITDVAGTHGYPAKEFGTNMSTEYHSQYW